MQEQMLDTSDPSITLPLIDLEPSYRRTNMRWVGLLLACMIMTGSYFCYDNPQALQTQLKKAPYNLSDFGVSAAL